MKPIDFPNKDHYYLTLAEEAFSTGDYVMALENYKLAYEEAPSIKLNHLIASLALEQGNFTEALAYAGDEQDSYLETLETLDLYLQIQLYTHNFFAAREFLWRAQKNKMLTEEQQNLWTLRIDDQEDFYQKQQQAAIKSLETELIKLPELSSMEQLQLVRKVKALSEERLKSWAEKWMLDPNVAPLVRSYLFENLGRVGVIEKVRYLTIQGEIVELSPAETAFDDSLQQEIEARLTNRLEDNDPILLANLLDQLKLEMAFLYPLQYSFMKPDAWAESYLAEYSGSLAELDEQVEAIRQKIRQMMFDYH